MRLFTVAGLLAATVLSSAVSCQAQAAWSTVSIPGGVTSTNATSIGKLVTYLDGGMLRVYSAFRRQWTSQPISAGAVVRLMNDCLAVQDGGSFTAYSAYRGTFAPLPVTGTAQLLNPGANNNDSILLVADGSQLHAFSCFTGTWTTRTMAPGFVWSVQRHTALASQGNLLTAIDAFTGQWHDLMVAASPTTISADGVAGFAFGPSAVHAFSAVHGTWQTVAPMPNATFVRADDWAMLYDSTQMLAYSGLQDRFDQLLLSVNTVLATEDLFGLFDTPAGAVAFSAIHGSFSAPLAPTPSRVAKNGAVAVLVEGNHVHGYSAVRNDSATLTMQSSNEGAASAIGYAIDGTTGIATFYSALTGLWHGTPLDVLPGDPVLSTTTALLTTPTGARAFSARTGNFVPLLAGNLTLSGNPSSAPVIAWNATDIFTFDARRDLWTGVARTAAGPVVPQIWRTTLLALDGLRVWGFGAQDGRWSTTTLTGPPTSMRANSESGRITTANEVLGYSALPELLSLAQFPEFRRVLTTGAPLRLKLPLAAGDLAVMGVNTLLPAPAPIPGLGLLQLDLVGLATTTVLSTPTGAPVDLVYQVPTTPQLIGSEWGFQAVVLPLAQAPWLTGACTIMIL